MIHALLRLMVFLFGVCTVVFSQANVCEGPPYLPPFLATSAPPNVLLITDVSGSMEWNAYYKNRFDPVSNDFSTACPLPSNRFTPCTSGDGFEEMGCYNHAVEYEGYFVPDRFYRYDSNSGTWVETSGPENCTMTARVRTFGLFFPWCYYYYSVSGTCSGNRLNFVFMSRIDLLRWAMLGGKPHVCLDGNFTDWRCDPDLACTGNTCRLTISGVTAELLDQRDVVVPTERVTGVIQELERGTIKPRLGIMFFSSYLRQEKVYIGDYPDGGPRNFPASDPCSADPSACPYTFLKRYLNAVDIGGSTAIAPAMWEAYDYFGQNDLHDYGNGFTISPGTYLDPQYVCSDPNNPNTCEPVPCAKNFVILMSDGQWNRGGIPINWSCHITTDFEFYSADPVVPAYRMHTDILRTLSVFGQNYDINVSAVYALGLFLGGTGEQALKNVAMYGSFDTSAGDWPGGTDTDSSLWNAAGRQYPWATCDVDNCGPGRGSPCTPLPSQVNNTTYPDWDKDGDGVPDTFLNARTATEIRNSLLRFITDILRKTSAASSVSILSRRGIAGNNIIQGVFYPQKTFPGDRTVDWVGYLYNYWFYHSQNEQSIREDTNQNRILDLDSDYKLEFTVDAAGNLKIRAYDNNNNLVTTYNSLDEVSPIWEAGAILKNTAPSQRKIYTVSTTDSMVEFTVANSSSFSALLGDPSTFPSCLSSSTDPVGDLVRFVRGEHIQGCRDRRVDDQGNTWKLGDIVYSTPAVLDYGDYAMVFVGANDGMLHAFRVGALRTDGLSGDQVVKLCDQLTGSCTELALGKEEWAFIPKSALPYLRYLADPYYAHDYTVDLAPYLVKLDTNDDGLPDRVILIGGMRLGGGCGCTGGSCDNPPPDVCDPVNDPAGCQGLSSYFALDVTSPQSPKFLWEFTHPDLGFSYSGPAHITVGNDHFVMFVSGPTNKCGDSAQELKIFVLKLDSQFNIVSRYIFYGNAIPTVSTGYTTVSSSTLASFNNSFGGRLFTEGIDYDEDGNTDMVFFGVSRNTGTGWQGNIIGVRITGSDPTMWDIIKVFNSAIEPITAKVAHMKCFGMNYIFFGTGRWFFKNDEPGQNTNDVEKIYGVRIDGCLTGGNCNINQAKNSSGACQELQTGGDVFAWKLELDPCVTSGSANNCNNAEYYKERMISDPAVTAFDAVFFVTTQPTGRLCGFGGRSRIWGLNCATGEPLSSSNCQGYVPEVPSDLSIIFHGSGGNITPVTPNEDFTQEGGAATEFLPGTPPETGPTIIGPGSTIGKMILWMER